MRYEGVRKSKNDPEVDVYLFALGIEEMNLLRGVVFDYYKQMPRLFELQPTKQRLKAIKDGLDQALTYRRLEKRNLGNS